MGAYRISAYYIARTVLTIPLDFIWPTCFVTLAYWMSCPNSAAVAFFGVLASTLLCVVAMQSVGLLISAAVRQGR